tara:strand:+ start:4917 stop:6296 length:1380 start_codon:yes stop_codon:yes gene_type:complete
MKHNSLNNFDKNNLGIVYTPKNLVDEILDLIPEKYFKNKDLKWLDIGAGKGAFSLNLYNRLLKHLSCQFENIEDCENHIIKNMLFMIEIYEPHINYLIELFGNESNIINKCFLSLNEYEYDKFNFIIGNPPYNISGSIKTPTNNYQKKTDDGRSIYVEFINKSLKMLHKEGFLNLIIPSLWLKTDKANLYNTLTNLKIHKLKCLCTSDSCKAFNYQAQTPTSFFLIENYDTSNWDYKSIKIYDKIENDFINYSLKPNKPIPINGINILKKLENYIDRFGSLKFNKTNTPPKKMILSETSGENFIFTNIKTCNLNGLITNIVLNYSNIKSQYCSNKPKLILPHKMYGFPYFDKEGIYGVSTRDNYIISGFDYTFKELEEIQYFLSTKFILFVFSCCCYRMRFLERAAFSFIPVITKIPNFPKLKNIDRENRDKLLYNFFNLSTKEIEFIENSFKNYKFFV